MGKAVLIGSQENEIGKTIICIKTGVNLSERGKKVLLIDLSEGKNKMSEYLNVNEDIIYDIKDVLDSTCSPEQAIIDINENLWLLPCPRVAGKLSSIKVEAFDKLINEVKNVYDIIIADIDKISSSYIDFNLIDNIVSINSNDFSCIKEFNRDKHIAKKFNVEVISVLNKYNRKNARKGIMLNIKEIGKMTEMEMNIVIDENIKYSDADYDFLFSNEDDTFNKAIKSLSEKLLQ